MTDEELLEHLQKEIMHEAYVCFLDWAGRKVEIKEEFYNYLLECGDCVPDSFVVWVTREYWGDEQAK